MKRIVAILMTVVMLIGAMTAFAMTSHADAPDAAIPNDSLDSTLTPGDRDYVFYAQTRTNRQNAEKKDVRIICVAKQSWLDSIPNFVATFTFTDGATPVELKSVGLDNVFKSITAYGTDGNVETYTAAEGAVIFGWIITEVPEAYADVATNVPTASVVTDPAVEPDVKPGVDYETPVEVMDNINVVTDGVYKDVQISNSGNNVKVGGIDHRTSKATYILTGNYEGFYDMEISYTDETGNRKFAVVVNGSVYIAKSPESTGSESWDDVTKAKTVTITVLMKKGANVISFMRADDNAPNLVDFDLKKNTTFGTVTNDVIVKAADKYSDLDDGSVVGDCTHGTKKVGWLNSTQSVTYTVEIPTEGKWMATLGYLSEDCNRKFALSIDEGDVQVIRIARTDSYDDETVAKDVAVFLNLTAGTHTIKISGYEGDAPNLLGFELVRIAD